MADSNVDYGVGTVVEHNKVQRLVICLSNDKIIKYFEGGKARWWVDENDQKVVLSPDEFEEMIDIAQNFFRGQKRLKSGREKR